MLGFTTVGRFFNDIEADLYFLASSCARSQARVQHSKILSRDTIERRWIFWFACKFTLLFTFIFNSSWWLLGAAPSCYRTWPPDQGLHPITARRQDLLQHISSFTCKPSCLFRTSNYYTWFPTCISEHITKNTFFWKDLNIPGIKLIGYCLEHWQSTCSASS